MKILISLLFFLGTILGHASPDSSLCCEEGATCSDVCPEIAKKSILNDSSPSRLISALMQIHVSKDVDTEVVQRIQEMAKPGGNADVTHHSLIALGCLGERSQPVIKNFLVSQFSEAVLNKKDQEIFVKALKNIDPNGAVVLPFLSEKIRQQEDLNKVRPILRAYDTPAADGLKAKIGIGTKDFWGSIGTAASRFHHLVKGSVHEGKCALSDSTQKTLRWTERDCHQLCLEEE